MDHLSINAKKAELKTYLKRQENYKERRFTHTDLRPYREVTMFRQNLSNYHKFIPTKTIFF